MRSSSTYLFSAILPLLALATDVPSGTSQVIVPFSTLPLCAQSCGLLFDVQGACGQTELTATSKSCFCGDARLAGFVNGGGTTAVCPASNCNAADSTSIQSWFTSYCASSGTGSTTTGTGTGSTPTGTTGSGSGSSGSGSNSNATPSNVWLASHYQYVIMIIVIVAGLAALWIGGAWLRRRSIRKRDMQYELRPPQAPWGPNMSHEFGPNGPPPMSQTSLTSVMSGGAGAPPGAAVGAAKGRSPLSREMPSSNSIEGVRGHEYNEKNTRKSGRLSKWMPGQRD